MVKSLTKQDKQAISAAITEAEKSTSAEIVLVVAETSDAYQDYVVLTALAIGSLIAGILWAENLLTEFPYLFIVQFAVIALFSCVPVLRNFCIRFIPKKIQQYRAAHRAYGEYINISQNIPATVPVLIFYISLAEHYAHIVAGRLVHEKIPDEIWDYIIDEFAKSVTIKSLPEACIEATHSITSKLARYFPADNTNNYLSDEVITYESRIPNPKT
jgi:putative membrane protein